MDVNAIRAIANAILYEGYMLYPYRPSALKNRSQGWTFGTLLPEKYAAEHPGEPSSFRSEVPVTGAQPRISVEIRFLQLRGSDAIERTVSVAPLLLSELTDNTVAVPFAFPEAGDTSGCYTVQGALRISAEANANGSSKVTVMVNNQSEKLTSWDTRDQALQQALVSAHALLTISDGSFVSLLNPPDEYRAAAASCTQLGVFPVLVGQQGECSAMLASPIILYDYPEVAADSHGDFFDSTEIDEMLTLRVLTLTDVEKEEMRAASDRTRALLQRTESLSPQQVLDLHGMLRDMKPSEE